jgi:hypothetical protein
MPALSSLKLTAAQKPNQIPVVQQRRNKLVKRLWEQAELAKARQAGTQFQPVQFGLVWILRQASASRLRFIRRSSSGGL